MSARPTPRHSPAGVNAAAITDAVRSRCASCGQPVGLWAVDRLTGVLDRWGWEDRAPDALGHAGRQGHTSALLVIDLDCFKDVNDRFGHVAGDDVLRTVADTLRRCTRRDDLVGRYGGQGGDEFLVLLPRTDLPQAFAVAERIRRRIRSTPIPTRTAAGTLTTLEPVTVSIGVAASPPGPELDLMTLLLRADAALREAKRAGRDRVRGLDPETRP